MPAIASTTTATPQPIAIFFPVLIVPFVTPFNGPLARIVVRNPAPGQSSAGTRLVGATGDTPSDTRLWVQKFQRGQTARRARIRGLAKRCVDNNTIISCAETDSMEENGRNRGSRVSRLAHEFYSWFGTVGGRNLVNRRRF